jgi:uncharacterized repeat protein (TIGR03803 family)
MATAAHKLKVLHSFCADSACPDGSAVDGKLYRDEAGNYFGTTQIGGANGQGVVFELVNKGDKFNYKVVHDFCSKQKEGGCLDGALPVEASFIEDVNGNLYTTTFLGGEHGQGTVFELMPNADHSKYKLKTLYDFCALSACNDGQAPQAGLTYQGQQNGELYDGVSTLYGTARSGGPNNAGVAFQLTSPSGKGKWTEKVIYSFCALQGCKDGVGPWTLVIDGDGNLFGTAYSGGAKGPGAVFELSPDGSGNYSERILHDFCILNNCADGGSPTAGLTQDANGNLYGTGIFGGANSNGGYAGVVFELRQPTKGNFLYQVIHSFCRNANCPDGSQPEAGLAIDSTGTLYGAAYQGGVGNGGTVFEIKNQSKFRVLHSFCATDCTDGKGPYADVTVDPSGNIFGTAIAGGNANGGGTVFEIKR